MKAVIVAAGMSTRMYPLKEARGIPKCLLRIDGVSIIERAVNILNSFGVHSIGVVVGYKADMIKEELGDSVTYIHNPFYEQCNNMASLWMAKDFVNEEEFVYIHGDVLFHSAILEELLTPFFDDTLVVDFRSPGAYDKEDMKVIVDDSDNLIMSSKDIDIKQANGEWIGLAKFKNSKVLFEEIDSLLAKGELLAYDVVAFNEVAKNYNIRCHEITNFLYWIEVDYPEDYRKAREAIWN